MPAPRLRPPPTPAICLIVFHLKPLVCLALDRVGVVAGA